MKICYVLHSFMTCGGVRIIFEHANRLSLKGHEVYLCKIYSQYDYKWFNFTGNINIISFQDALNIGFFESCDAVIATFWATAYNVNNIDKIKGKKYYFVQQRESNFYNQMFNVNEYNLAENSYKLPLNIITIAKWMQDFLLKDFNKESFLVRNGLDENLFYPEPIMPTTNKPTILIEGSPTNKWKGIDIAYKSLENLPVEIWSLSTDNETRSNIHYKNPPQDKIRQIYSSADILLKTSISEGLPAPQAEAMACGCAVVSTDIQGSNEYCIDNHNCLLVKPNDIENTRNAVIKLIENKELLDKLIINGFKTVKDKFNWNDKIDLLENIYSNKNNTKSKW